MDRKCRLLPAMVCPRDMRMEQISLALSFPQVMVSGILENLIIISVPRYKVKGKKAHEAWAATLRGSGNNAMGLIRGLWQATAPSGMAPVASRLHDCSNENPFTMMWGQAPGEH